MKANYALLKKAAVTTTLTGTVLAIPTVANAHFGNDLMAKGMKDDHVKELQKVLHKEGYYKINKTSNYFGAATEKAVRDFQKEHDLKVDGLVGPNTKQELNKKVEYSGELLHQGKKGEKVKTIQEDLEKLGYYRGDIDGIYGSKTRLAVLRFQKENDIKVDGIVGPKTFKAMHHDPEKRKVAATATKSETTTNHTTKTAQSNHSKEENNPPKKAQTAVKELHVESTAYTAYCSGCSGTTATGINLRANPNAKVVAVDPDVIPLGTKLYIEGYGYAVAGDTGGDIQGRRIDVFMSDREEALDWGRKTVKVKVLN